MVAREAGDPSRREGKSRLESGGQWRRPIYLDFVRERLESARAIFTEENGDGPGLRLRKSEPKSLSADE